MLENEEIRSIEKGMKVLTIIWAAMLLSLLAYLMVGTYAAGTFTKSLEGKSFQTLRNAFYGISLITLVVTRYVRNAVLKSKRTGSLQGSSLQHPVLEGYSRAMIVSLAMSESIGVYGLVLAFLGGSTADLYILTAISAGAMISYKPRKDEVERLANQQKKLAGDASIT